MFATGTVTVLCVLLSISVTMEIIWQRGQWQHQMHPVFGGVVAAAVISLWVELLNAMFFKLVALLTDWENHRADDGYEYSLICKLLFFQFFNFYWAALYIAFVKPFHPSFLGYEDWCHDLKDFNRTQSQIKAMNEGHNPHCMDELFIQLMTQIIVSNITNQVFEYVVPIMMRDLRAYFNRRRQVKDAQVAAKEGVVEARGYVRSPAPWEEEGNLPKYEGVLLELDEMVIQYGFVTLFAAAFPLSALLALMNNAYEIKVDSTKILFFTQRPRLQRSSGIETWQTVLEALSTISIISNLALLGFTSSMFSWNVGLSSASLVGAVVILEHGILTSRLLIAEIIPDIPSWVASSTARQKFERDNAIAELHDIPPYEETLGDQQDEDMEYDSE